MAYSIYNDLLFEFSESELAILTGDPTGTTVDTGRIDFARVSADTMIGTYLWGIYNVPFDQEAIYPLIRKLSVDLTIVFLYEIAYKNSALPNAMIWRRIYAVKMLKDLRDGKITVMDVEHATAPPRIISNKSEIERKFSKEVLDRFSE